MGKEEGRKEGYTLEHCDTLSYNLRRQVSGLKASPRKPIFISCLAHTFPIILPSIYSMCMCVKYQVSRHDIT